MFCYIVNMVIWQIGLFAICPSAWLSKINNMFIYFCIFILFIFLISLTYYGQIIKLIALIHPFILACSFFDSFFLKHRCTKFFLSILNIFFNNFAIAFKDLIFYRMMLLTENLSVSIGWIWYTYFHASNHNVNI